MAVFALWSGPRSRSTAFFRSMLERGDLLALHEPLEGLHFIGPLQAGSQSYESPEELLAWLVGDDSGDGQQVFLKETVNPPVQRLVLQHRSFLTDVHHTFLVRRPVEIAASWYALEGDMRIMETGVELLYDLFVAVRQAQGHPPVVIDSDDLVTRPAQTMAAYCDAVGLPFIADALTWEPDVEVEWARSPRWHRDAAESSRFNPTQQRDRHNLHSHPDVVRFAARHAQFYERLIEHRLDVDRQG